MEIKKMDIKKAEKLAKALMKRHNLEHLRFKWSKGTRTFGRCKYVCDFNRNLVPVEIQLSRPITLLNHKNQVKETLLHEIAHAKTPGHKHDKVWQKNS